MDQLENVSVSSQRSEDKQPNGNFQPITNIHKAKIEDGEVKTISIRTYHSKEEDPWYTEIIAKDSFVEEKGEKYEIPYNSEQYTNTYKLLEKMLKNHSDPKIFNQLTESLKQKYQKHIEDFNKPLIIEDNRVDQNLSVTFFGNNGSSFAKSESHTQYGGEALRFTFLVKDTSKIGRPPSYRAYSLSGILALEIKKKLEITKSRLKGGNNMPEMLNLCEKKFGKV